MKVLQNTEHRYRTQWNVIFEESEFHSPKTVPEQTRWLFNIFLQLEM